MLGLLFISGLTFTIHLRLSNPLLSLPFPDAGALLGIWMSEPSIRISESDFIQLSEAALDLSESAARFARVLERLSSSRRWDVVPYPVPQSWIKENDKLKLFLRFRGVEDGPPETPRFLLNFGDYLSHLPSEEDRDLVVRPIFVAGFWAKASLDCSVPHTALPAAYYPEKALHWLVLRGGSWPEPALFLSEEDVHQFVGNSTFSNNIVQPLGDWNEVFIFCSGAEIDPPSQWRWRRET